MKYAIIFHDKSIKWVEQKKAMNISKLMDDGKPRNFSLDDSIYITSAIAKILSEREYIEQYPNKNQGRVFVDNYPKLDRQDLIDYKHETIKEQVKRNKNSRNQLLKGLQRYIDENPDRCENAKALLKSKDLLKTFYNQRSLAN